MQNSFDIHKVLEATEIFSSSDIEKEVVVCAFSTVRKNTTTLEVKFRNFPRFHVPQTWAL